jgi:hypothetical protein
LAAAVPGPGGSCEAGQQAGSSDRKLTRRRSAVRWGTTLMLSLLALLAVGLSPRAALAQGSLLEPPYFFCNNTAAPYTTTGCPLCVPDSPCNVGRFLLLPLLLLLLLGARPPSRLFSVSSDCCWC